MKKIQILKNTIYKINFVLTKRQKEKSCITVILMLVSAVFELLGVTLIIPFIYAVMDMEKLLSNVKIVSLIKLFNIKDNNLIVYLGGVLICIYFLKNLILIISRYIQNRYCLGIQKDISVKMLIAYMSYPYEYFLSTNTANIRRGVKDDVDGFFYILQHILGLFAELITTIPIIVFIFMCNWQIALTLVFIAIISLIFLIKINKYEARNAGSKRRNAIADRDGALFQITGGIKDIFVTQRKDIFVEKYDIASERYKQAEISSLTIQMIPERLFEFLLVSGIIVVVMIQRLTGVESSVFFAQLASIAVACFRLLPSLNKISNALNVFLIYESYMNNVYEVIKEGINQDTQINEIEIEKKDFTHIYVNTVSWNYLQNSKDTLKNASLDIKKGESIGIVGESGAGKTTLADIILGLLPPKTGKILLDDVDIYENRSLWSKYVGYVPQTVFLMDDTIRNNVLFGLPHEDDNKIWDVLEMAQLADFVRNLPNQLDTVVGERGVKFSGGQRQRIAISRALYSQPEILVLDEATSALDDGTEQAVMDAIESLHGKMTLIIIAHRLTTIEKCDKVYEVKDGKICDTKWRDICLNQ